LSQGSHKLAALQYYVCVRIASILPDVSSHKLCFENQQLPLWPEKKKEAKFKYVRKHYLNC